MQLRPQPQPQPQRAELRPRRAGTASTTPAAAPPAVCLDDGAVVDEALVGLDLLVEKPARFLRLLPSTCRMGGAGSRAIAAAAQGPGPSRSPAAAAGGLEQAAAGCGPGQCQCQQHMLITAHAWGGREAVQCSAVVHCTAQAAPAPLADAYPLAAHTWMLQAGMRESLTRPTCPPGPSDAPPSRCRCLPTGWAQSCACGSP
jgi:hypothetical protein